MEIDMETASLLDHDSVAENYERGAPVETGEVAASQGAPKYTTKATLQVNVDDALHFKDLDHVEKKHDIEQISAKVLQTKYSVFIRDYGSMTEAPKKVDESGNALQQQQNAASKAKKKKVQAEKNVMSSYSAEKLVGHRGDIINDVDKLVEFIGDGGAQNKGGKHRQKQQQTDKNAADKGGKKQRAAAAQSNKVNKETAKGGDLKKSNSLEEVSTTKLDGFKFDEDDKEETKAVEEKKKETKAIEEKKKEEPEVEKVKAVKQQPERSEEAKAKPGKKEEPQQQQVQEKTKGEVEKAEPKKVEKAEPKKVEKAEPKKVEKAEPKKVEKAEPKKVEKVEKAEPKKVEKAEPKTVEASQEKPKERKLWDGVESASGLESSATEFRVVTKKKKTKKRRNSLSGTGHKPLAGVSSSAGSVGLRSGAAACGPSEQRRGTSSPTAPRGKSACSVPHSEKSNDDSSGVDSVHSLPAAASSAVGGQPHRRDAPISCADVAKKPEPPRKQFADAKVGRDAASDQGSPKANQPATYVAEQPASPAVVTVNAQTQTTPPKAQPPPPPDVSNVRSFPAIGNKVDKGMNTPRPQAQQQQPQARIAQAQQQVQDRQRVAQCNSANRNVVKVQTVVASSQTCNNVPDQQQQQQQQQQQPQQQQYRDIKTDLSRIQANEMETIQYNNQIMPRMEIPDVQTIEKLNYMSQPGAHMPLHLQHHVVPPQHLHMAPPPTHYPPPPPQQQHRPVVNQPSHHVQMLMQQQPPPDMYHAQQPAYHQNATPAVIVHHTHSFTGSPLQLGFPAQAYEGMAVAYVEHPAFAQQAPPSQAPPQQPTIVSNHHQQQQHHQQHQQHQQQPQQEKKWADSPDSGRPKPKQRRYDKTQGHPDRRKDNNRPPNQQTPPHHQPATTNQAVTIYRRGDPAPPRTRAEPAATAPPKEDGDIADNERGGDCASSGEEGQQERPPVVILSGGAKDVPGIEFGFDLNPDLVDQREEEVVEEEEDEEALPSSPVEIFETYFQQPAAADAALFNHDKVVHFVGTAWEDVINSGKAQYFASTPSN